MRHFFLYISLLAFTGCIKDIDIINGPEINFSGKAVDYKTGQPITNAIIDVTGTRYSGGLLFNDPQSVSLGKTLIDSRGNFNLKFKKWDAAGTFYFMFSEIPDYFRRDFHLNAANVRSTDTVQKFTRKTSLNIHFKNVSPFDINDALSFGIYQTEPGFEPTLNSCPTNLQSGIIDTDNSTIKGNAEGDRICPVGSDRKYLILYNVKKNGISTNYRDSIFCVRDVINVYYLNY